MQRARRAFSDRKAAEHVPEGLSTKREHNKGARAQRGVTQLEYEGLRVFLVTFASSNNASIVDLYGFWDLRDQHGGARLLQSAPGSQIQLRGLVFLVLGSSRSALLHFSIASLGLHRGPQGCRRLFDLKIAQSSGCTSRLRSGKKIEDEGMKDRTYEIGRVSLSSGRDPRFARCFGSGYFASNLLRRQPDTFWPIAFHRIETHRLGWDSTLDTELGSAIDSDLEIIPSRIGRQGCSVELVYKPRRQAAFVNALYD